MDKKWGKKASVKVEELEKLYRRQLTKEMYWGDDVTFEKDAFRSKEKKCIDCRVTFPTTTREKRCFTCEKKRSMPVTSSSPLILDTKDDLSWIEDLIKMGILEPQFEETRKKLESLLSIDSIEEYQDFYTKGYQDGFNLRKNSVLWSQSEDYRKGWTDGDGDKVME